MSLSGSYTMAHGLCDGLCNTRDEVSQVPIVVEVNDVLWERSGFDCAFDFVVINREALMPRLELAATVTVISATLST
jgi:hypothetical protein